MAKTKINDRWYEATLPYEMTVSDEGTEIRPVFDNGSPVRKLVNKCPKCHRGDWQQVVYRSLEEAINAGLFVESSAP